MIKVEATGYMQKGWHSKEIEVSSQDGSKTWKEYPTVLTVKNTTNLYASNQIACYNGKKDGKNTYAYVNFMVFGSMQKAICALTKKGDNITLYGILKFDSYTNQQNVTIEKKTIMANTFKVNKIPEKKAQPIQQEVKLNENNFQSDDNINWGE